jgi:hypothetical protein
MCVLLLLISIAGVNGILESMETTTKCFDYNAVQCYNSRPTGDTCDVYTNPIFYNEQNSLCNSYDRLEQNNIEITELDLYLEVSIKCPQMTSSIVATNVSYFLSKNTNNICKNPGCISGQYGCKIIDCECEPLDDLTTCEESYLELVEEINEQCNNSRGKCNFYLPRRQISNCDRAADANCINKIDSNYSYCYGQYVKIDFNCSGKFNIYLFTFC